MKEGGQDSLDRLRKLSRPLRFLRVRIRLLAAAAIGLLTLLLLPRDLRWSTRTLIAWDVTAAIYLVTAFWVMAQASITHIRHHALVADDGRFAILFVTAAAALASFISIIAEIGPTNRGAIQIALAIATITLSWVMVHTSFALHYAHDYYRPKEGGLKFPDENEPDYWDFVYFSFVVGMTAQVSDVAITDRTIRRTATAHGVVSFVFNTALLALMVNIAASAL